MYVSGTSVVVVWGSQSMVVVDDEDVIVVVTEVGIEELVLVVVEMEEGSKSTNLLACPTLPSTVQVK